ncbi:MAG: type II toxin-antitoxin system prevent-host-death family antitoxin [Clostridia bacterium]|nr:type II toxin-antitoxin system prevent-host-death family antitoxin [Clostridia bacterium]
MPTILSEEDLRNGYNEISAFCHTHDEPVFITRNGKADLAVMSIEHYEKITGRFELHEFIRDGLDEIKNGNTRLFAETMADIRANRKR